MAKQRISIFTNHDLAALIARLTFGGLMIPHGWSKFQRLLQSDEIHFADPLGIGEPLSLYLTIFSELVCALALVLGFLTRLSSTPLMFTMLIAAFVIHAQDSWSNKETALLYFFGFLTTFLLGSGTYSLDKRLFGRKRK